MRLKKRPRLPADAQRPGLVFGASGRAAVGDATAVAVHQNKLPGPKTVHRIRQHRVIRCLHAQRLVLVDLPVATMPDRA